MWRVGSGIGLKVSIKEIKNSLNPNYISNYSNNSSNYIEKKLELGPKVLLNSNNRQP
jgi:hypothetical protein